MNPLCISFVAGSYIWSLWMKRKARAMTLNQKTTPTYGQRRYALSDAGWTKYILEIVHVPIPADALPQIKRIWRQLPGRPYNKVM